MHIEDGQFQVSKVMDDGPFAFNEALVQDVKLRTGRGGQAFLF